MGLPSGLCMAALEGCGQGAEEVTHTCSLVAENGPKVVQGGDPGDRRSVGGN